jgi:hypothetical protein
MRIGGKAANVTAIRTKRSPILRGKKATEKYDNYDQKSIHASITQGQREDQSSDAIVPGSCSLRF